MKRIFQIREKCPRIRSKKAALRVMILCLLYTVGLLPESLSQGPPVFTDSPIMLGLQGRGIRTFGQFAFKESADSYTQVLAVPYNLLTNTQLGFSIPFLRVSKSGESSQSGIGNLNLSAKQLIFKKDGIGKTFRTAIRLRQTLPVSNDLAIKGIGSAAAATSLALVNGYVTLNYSIYGTLGYRIVGDGKPDYFHYDFTFGKPLLPQKYPPHQINVYLGINGQVFPEMNKHYLHISPAVQYITGRNFLIETGVQVPINDTETTDLPLNILLGIRFLFN